jgi:stage III sporulation protein AE
MKKKAVFCLVFIAVITLLAITANAAGETEDVERAIPDIAREALDGADAGDVDSSLGRIWSYIRDKSGGILSDTLKGGMAVLLVPIFCSVAGALYDEKLPDAITLVGALSIAALCLRGTGSFIGLGRELVDELDAFSKVLLPTLAAAAASGGAVTSSAAKYAAASMFIELLVNMANSVIIPLIYAYIAASIGGAIFGGGLNAAAKITKWAAVSAMTVTVLAFTLYITVTGVISGSTDAAAIKVTKTAISSALPVVGSIISDAASAVVSGAEMLKNTVGVMGMTVILAACAIPVIRMGMNHLLFKAVASLSEPLGGEKLSKVIAAVGTATGMMMGCAAPW